MADNDGDEWGTGSHGLNDDDVDLDAGGDDGTSNHMNKMKSPPPFL